MALDWSEFLCSNSSHSRTFYNGEKFEELVYRLLTLTAPGQWKRTGRTWDGGKDISLVDSDGKEIWAECKNYADVISLGTVSNTVVMAIAVGTVKRILIFSKSRMARESIRRLGMFSDETAISIQCFDGSKLEQLILSKFDYLKPFFPNDNPKNSADLFHCEQNRTVRVRDFLSANPSIDANEMFDTDVNLLGNKHSIPVNSVFLYQIFVENSDPLLENTVQLKGSRNFFDSSHFLIINEKALTKRYRRIEAGDILIKLEPASVVSIKLYLRAVKHGTFLLPSLSVVTECNGDQFERFPSREIRVSLLNRPELVGVRVHDILREFEHVPDRHVSTLTLVHGRSGVGKSRLVEEMQICLYSQGYVSVVVDGREPGNSNYRGFFRSLIARLWQLPDPQIFNDIDRDVTAVNQSSDLYARLCHLLYDTSCKKEDIFFDDALELIKTGLKKQRILLVIDNAQSLDRVSIKLLDCLQLKIVGARCDSQICYVFNTEELIFSDGAAIFFQKLKSKAIAGVQYAGNFVVDIELKEFTDNEVEEFLDRTIKSADRRCGQSFCRSYPKLKKKIIDNVLPRPLDLFQFIKLTEDLGCAQARDGFYVVRDPTAFFEAASKLQRGTEAILERRWQKIAETGEIERDKVLIAAILLGRATRSLLNRTTSSAGTIDSLIASGIFSEDLGGRIGFYHPSIERHFTLKIRSAVHQSIRKAAQSLYGQKAMDSALDPITRFSLARLSGMDTEEHLIAALHAFTARSETEVVRPTIAISAIHMLEAIKQAVGITSEFEIISAAIPICRAASLGKMDGMSKSLVFLSNRLEGFKPKSEYELAAVTRLDREAASNARVFDHTQFGVGEINLALCRLRTRSRNFSPQIRMALRSDLLNRKCVCLKQKQQLGAAIRYGELALRLARRAQAHDVACLSLIDLGYIHFDGFRGVDKVCRYWREAGTYFEAHRSAIEARNPGMAYAAPLIGGSLAILKNDFVVAIHILDELIHKCFDEGSTYYACQALLTKAAAVLLQEKYGMNFQRIDIVDELVSTAEDLAISSELTQFLKNCHFMSAIVADQRGDFETAQARFDEAIRCLEPTIAPSASDLAILMQWALFAQEHAPCSPSRLTPSQEVSLQRFRDDRGRVRFKAITAFSNHWTNIPSP